MLLNFFRKKNKQHDDSIFEKIVKVPVHLQDILLDRYFIEGSEMPDSSYPVMNDLKIMFDKLMSITETFTCVYLNPFSNRYIKVELNPSIKVPKETSYMETNDKFILKQRYFESMKVVIVKSNVLEKDFNDVYSNFKNILYHELAHAHFGNLLTVMSRKHEINADISNIIYIIKHEDLSLEAAKLFIDDMIRMRIRCANLFRYTRQLCQFTRVHGTEQALILFRCMDEDILNNLKTIPSSDIVRFVSLWLSSMSLLLDNPYDVDFQNKSLVSFLFHNNYNSDLMKPDIDKIFFVRIAHLYKHKNIRKIIKNRLKEPSASQEEINIMKDFYLLNILLNKEHFNDFMTTHLLSNSFDYIVDNLFNKDDYKYAFMDSISAYQHYKDNRTNTTLDIPFGYNSEFLNNFINKHHCKI